MEKSLKECGYGVHNYQEILLNMGEEKIMYKHHENCQQALVVVFNLAVKGLGGYWI